MKSEIAEDALAHYDVVDAQIHFIGQSQNTTFRVETSKGEEFLLRLHAGISADANDLFDIWQESPTIQSELLWLNALRNDTHLSVPQPIRNRSGEWVTEVLNSATPKPLCCTLLRWVEGEHLAAEPTPEQASLLGALMAQLHQHAGQWHLPPNFTRPHHDAAQLQTSLLKLRPLSEQGIISATDYEIFQASVSEIEKLMLSLERNTSTWGIVHADLQDANYVLHQGEIRPIDFGRCGFGFYLYDVALSLGYLSNHLHPHFFDGYLSVRSLPHNYEPIVEAFFLSSIIENFAFLGTNPLEHTGISKSVPLDVKSYFQPYLRGEAFLFEK